MPGEPVVILKADPTDAEAHRAAHASISPGYHMNKKHWITVRAGADVEPVLVDNLVTESYLLVVAGLPKQSVPSIPLLPRPALRRLITLTPTAPRALLPLIRAAPAPAHGALKWPAATTRTSPSASSSRHTSSTTARSNPTCR
jgi:hypothetical protein